MKLAHNRCRACKHEWHDGPGQFATVTGPNNRIECPKCGSLYWDWLNYQSDFAKKE